MFWRQNIVGQQKFLRKLSTILMKLDQLMENLKILLFLIRSNTPKFIDFIMAEMFDWIDNSYLVNLVNSQKIKGKAQISLLFHLMDCKYGEKNKRV